MVSSLSPSAHSNLFAAPLQGIQRGMQQMGAAAQRVAEGDVSAANVVQQIEAEMLVKANVVAARTVDEILGSLLDTLA